MRALTEANLQRARMQLDPIKEKIKAGTFSFLEEFQDYRYQDELDEVKREQARRLTCSDVFKAFIAHCEIRVAMNDMAYSTLDVLRRFWRQCGDLRSAMMYSRTSSTRVSLRSQRDTRKTRRLTTMS